ncbi:MAG: cytochrome c biogenesis protein CcsA [Parachlamydia sp.]|nr:cytochrome c biogenesis protein CcsA [Parachlamydia sp.]
MWFLALFLALTLPLEGIELDTSALASVPASYKGRFRPADSYARLWLADISHRQSLISRSALNFLWELHFMGKDPWEDAPLFWIQRAEQKSQYHLHPKQSRFSYRELEPLHEQIKDENLLANLRHFERLEGFVIQAEKGYEESLANLKKLALSPKEIAWRLDTEWPIRMRLAQAGTTFLLLPDRSGSWRSLKALKLQHYDDRADKLVPISNFTPYSDSAFQHLQTLYREIEMEFQKIPRNNARINTLTGELSSILLEAYNSLSGMPYREAYQKKLHYPTHLQLEAERLYYQLPLVEVCVALYGAAACMALLSLFRPSRMGSRISSYSLQLLIGIAFLLHTILLALRCYILMRPPVSNMFETVLYVPWVAVLAALFLRLKTWLFAAALTSCALLALLKVTQVNSSMENVQAVLDSQYWLIIHVLMVVGSYGLFFLCGVLGHCYLFAYLYRRRETESMAALAGHILQTMYLGVFLLIPGTILGGVWAAESWGRFWDWDPKESWAFISSCVYLLWIHAYRFRYIGNFGLAIGSIAGLQAIGFTWYGVNYILGTGLHSYGFGSGGEHYYYLFSALEGMLLIAASLFYRKDIAQKVT